MKIIILSAALLSGCYTMQNPPQCTVYQTQRDVGAGVMIMEYTTVCDGKEDLIKICDSNHDCHNI